MRNLLEHPITAKEIWLKLRELTHNQDPEAIGDMTPLLLQTAAQIVLIAEAIRRSVSDAQQEGFAFSEDHPLIIVKEQLDEAFNSQMPKVSQ